MKKFGFFAIIALIALTLASCSDKEDENPRKSAMLMYMAANSNLDVIGGILGNIDIILQNYVPSDNKELFIFYKGKDSYLAAPTLYRVVKKNGAKKTELVAIKKYDASINTLSASTLSQVMNEVSALPNITVIDDLWMSSHGSSWLPEPKDMPALSRGFGSENGRSSETMQINDMAKVLEQFNLNSIVFDACFMGSIEVYYQLRNSAKYILAAPGEILLQGLNYNFATQYFTQKMEPSVLIAIANATNDEYMKMSDSNQSSVLTVTACSELEEFGSIVKEIVGKYGSAENNLKATPVERYDNPGGYAKDYKNYLYNLIQQNNGSEKIRLDEVWARTFLHYCHTPKLLGMLSLENTHGVAGYIYHKDSKANVNALYSILDWGKLILVSQ